jgi:hypothetical protein
MMETVIDKADHNNHFFLVTSAAVEDALFVGELLRPEFCDFRYGNAGGQCPLYSMYSAPSIVAAVIG